MEKKSLVERKNELEWLLTSSNKSETKSVKEMIRRTQYRLTKENRVGMRKRGWGKTCHN